MAASSRPVRPIARWKIVGGAFVHFALPVYVLAAVADALRSGAMMAAPQATAIVPVVLRDSGFGLAIYAGLALGATGLAALLDLVASPARADRDSLPLVIVEARGRFGAIADEALDQLVVLGEVAADPRFATLAQHCEALLDASLRALKAASADRRPEIAERTAEALDSLAQEARALRAEAGVVHDEAAATLARFVVARYGRSDLEQSGATAVSDSAGKRE